MNNRSKKLLALSGAIWFVANMHMTVIPSHFINLKLPEYTFGISYGVTVFFMFIMAPIWTSLGERGYRTVILNVATVLFGIVQISLGYVESFFGIIFLRALGGAVASGFQVGLLLLLLDLNLEGNRELTIAGYTIIMNLSKSLGFLFGGILGFFPVKYVFYIQGSLMLFISIVVKMLVDISDEDSMAREVKKPKFLWDYFREARFQGILNFWTVSFFIITFLVAMSYSGYNVSFNYYLTRQLGYRPIVNGIFKALVGSLGQILNLTFNIWLIEKTKSKKALTLLLLLSSSLGLAGVFSGELIFILTALLYLVVYTIEIPILQSFAAKDKNGQIGLIIGVFTGCKYLGEMSGALISGFAYVVNPRLPFLLASLVILLAFLFSFYNYIQVKN